VHSAACALSQQAAGAGLRRPVAEPLSDLLGNCGSDRGRPSPFSLLPLALRSGRGQRRVGRDRLRVGMDDIRRVVWLPARHERVACHERIAAARCGECRPVDIDLKVVPYAAITRSNCTERIRWHKQRSSPSRNGYLGGPRQSWSTPRSRWLTETSSFWLSLAHGCMEPTVWRRPNHLSAFASHSCAHCAHSRRESRPLRARVGFKSATGVAEFATSSPLPEVPWCDRRLLWG
jgi:hypothetical protein